MENSRFKVRAWDADNKIMWFDLTALECLVQSIKFIEHYKSFTFMQFTGLRDKNGKEIYEGDILRPIGHAPERMGQFVIKYNEKAARFKCDNGHLICIASEDWHEREVLGNIYENPELLEEAT